MAGLRPGHPPKRLQRIANSLDGRGKPGHDGGIGGIQVEITVFGSILGREANKKREESVRFRTAIAAAALMAFTAEAGAETAVKIGVLNDQSSLYKDMSGEGSAVAARLAIDDFKAAGKGLKVEVVSADHQNKPDVAVNTGREWFDQQGVDIIVDVPNSGVALAISELAKEKNKVFIDSRRGGFGFDRPKMLAEYHPLDLRHLGTGQRNRQRHREARRK